MPGSSLSLSDRFFQKFRQGRGCWIWTGAKNSQGYGYIKHKGKMIKASRVSYEIFKGKFPPELVVRHSCDNPACVNPCHLLLGTHKDNSKDMMMRGRNYKNYKEAQLLGAKAKHRKVFQQTLPEVVFAIGTLLKKGINPTTRICGRHIPKFFSVKRYFSQHLLVRMAEEVISAH